MMPLDWNKKVMAEGMSNFKVVSYRCEELLNQKRFRIFLEQYNSQLERCIPGYEQDSHVGKGQCYDYPKTQSEEG